MSYAWNKSHAPGRQQSGRLRRQNGHPPRADLVEKVPMRSLRTRLIALWAMLAASALVTGFLLLQFYRQSANVQVARL